MNRAKPYQTLSSRIDWHCPWYQIRKDEIITPDGQRGEYNVIESPVSVWVVPVTPANEIVLIYNYRYTVDQWCWEVPAGAVEPGQTVLEAAMAELKQEAGGTAVEWVPIGQFFTAPGICNEDGRYFLATGVTLGKPEHEATEVMEIHQKPIPDVYQMLQNGQITDGNSALGLLAAQPYLLNH